MLFIAPPLHADDPLAAGKAALDKKDYLAAIPLLRDATQKDKKNQQAFILLGKALIGADSLDQAVAALVQARELDTAKAEVYALLGDVYSKQKIAAGAVDQYKIATRLDSTNADIFLKLAESYRKTRAWTDAAKTYYRVLFLDSMNTVALWELGSILNRAKHYADAAPIFERLVRLQPDSLDVLDDYGKALFEIREYEKFIPVGEKILKLDPSQSDVQAMLAEAYKSTGNYQQAIKRWESVPIDSLSLNDLIGLAKAYRANDQLDKAVETYQRAFRKDTSRCDIPYDFGTLYMQVKNYPAAVDMFQRKVSCDTSSGYRFASHLNAGMCLMQVKQFDDAKDQILKAIEFRPEDVKAWLTLAEDYAQLGSTAEEVKAYRKVIELATPLNDSNGGTGKYDSALREAYYILGVQDVLDKKYATSVDFLKKALQLTPKDAKDYCQVTLLLAQAYHNSQNKEEAKRYYCKVLQMCTTGKVAEDAKKGLELLGMTCGD